MVSYELLNDFCGLQVDDREGRSGIAIVRDDQMIAIRRQLHGQGQIAGIHRAAGRGNLPPVRQERNPPALRSRPHRRRGLALATKIENRRDGQKEENDEHGRRANGP
jgi:hypothetical protein